MEPGLIEQGEIYRMQSPTVKEQENLLQKKLNIMQGLRSESCFCQDNCSYSEIYRTIKAEEIPISLSAIKRV